MIVILGSDRCLLWDRVDCSSPEVGGDSGLFQRDAKQAGEHCCQLSLTVFKDPSRNPIRSSGYFGADVV